VVVLIRRANATGTVRRIAEIDDSAFINVGDAGTGSAGVDWP
jgi:hypothetical protein